MRHMEEMVTERSLGCSGDVHGAKKIYSSEDDL
jgi:hypothetical protein